MVVVGGKQPRSAQEHFECTARSLPTRGPRCVVGKPGHGQEGPRQPTRTRKSVFEGRRKRRSGTLCYLCPPSSLPPPPPAHVLRELFPPYVGCETVIPPLLCRSEIYYCVHELAQNNRRRSVLRMIAFQAGAAACCRRALTTVGRARLRGPVRLQQSFVPRGTTNIHRWTRVGASTTACPSGTAVISQVGCMSVFLYSSQSIPVKRRIVHKPDAYR